MCIHTELGRSMNSNRTVFNSTLEKPRNKTLSIMEIYLPHLLWHWLLLLACLKDGLTCHISFEAITVMHLTSNSLSHTMSARRKRYIIDGDITGRCWTLLCFEDYCKCSRLVGELTEIVGSTEPAITLVSSSLPHLQVEGRPDGQCRPEPSCRLS